MMDTSNWTVMLLAGGFNVACLRLVPYLYRSVLWEPYRERYEKFSPPDKFDFDGRFPQIILGLVSTGLAGWTFLCDPSFNRHAVVGATEWGNIALDITIGHFVSDLIYDVVLHRRKPKTKQILHHTASIVGACFAHSYFHAFALYRYVHDLTLPLVGVFAQMASIEVSVHSSWYKLVSVANVMLFTALRALVIPFHYYWMLPAFVKAPDRSQVPVIITFFFFLISVILDVINCNWSLRIIQIFNRNRKQWSSTLALQDFINV